MGKYRAEVSEPSMLEPLPYGIPDEFLTVQVIAIAYIVLSLGITLGLVALAIPRSAAVPAFLVVATVLLIPFWPLIRRYYPQHAHGPET